MESIIKLFSLIVFPIHVNGQGELMDYPQIPESCGIRPYMNRQCCLFPPFFNREVAKECGAKFELRFDNRANVTGFRRGSELGCMYWRCLLKKYDLNLAKDEKKLDDVKFYDHLSSWVELNPEFSNVMVKAKMDCKQTFRTSLPLRVCEFFHFHSCIRNYIVVNCPRVIQTEECMEMKKFYEQCREFYQ